MGSFAGLHPLSARSSHRKDSVKIGVLKNFTNFTGKHLCWIFFIKKWLQHSCFPEKYAKFLRTLTLRNICERRLAHPELILSIIFAILQIRSFATLAPERVYLIMRNIFHLSYFLYSRAHVIRTPTTRKII